VEKDPLFKKYVYWLSAKEEGRLRDQLAKESLRMKQVKGVVCTPLDLKTEIASVGPDVWNDTCSRQGSWYRASDKNGLFLVVSSFDLAAYGHRPAATITMSDFKPPRLATLEDKKRLVGDPIFKNRIPAEWHEVRDLEKKIYLRWSKRMGSMNKDYDFLFLSHTANHANFLNPSFYVREGDTLIPYSIDNTAHLCSCCVELFQILGSNYPKKLVAPCPGATLFARLQKDRYLLVETT
jgi:hypothetical protein